MFSHIYWLNPAKRFYRKITGQSTLFTSLTDSAQLRTLFADHAPLSASSIISQQYCKLQSSHKCHLSLNGDERPLLMVCFLKHWRWLCRCTIKTRLRFPSYTKRFYKWHLDSKNLFGLELPRCDVLSGKLHRNCFCFVFFELVQSTSESKFAYLSFTHVQRIQKWLR